MRNRAKCKLCQSIIESFHPTDYVECKCGEISVCEGSALKCAAKNYQNFVRVDDEGNEVVVRVDVEHEMPIPNKITKADLAIMLDEMIANIEKMPSHAKGQPINHYDFLSALILFSALLKVSD